MNRVEGLSLGNQVEFTLTVVNSMMHYFSSFAYFHRLCLHHWPADEPTFGMNMKKTPMFMQNCPLAFSNHRPPIKAMRVNLKEPKTIYFDYDSSERSQFIRDLLDQASNGLILLGVALHFLKVRLSFSLLVAFALVANFALSIPGYYDMTHRFGVDYNAYLQ
mmetsp:Transcript_1806/g.2401  ORF Transcript_1806/g.2401 Transcript_1806/m.2401 type:complete len:162 (+) Transcript_1806:1860-2345(+)